jgi:hypothetical protein
MVNFSVSGGAADPKLPVTTNSGQQMSNANSNANADAKPTPEGKDMQFNGQGTLVNAGAPLLTYSRPKGEYKGADTDAVMIDFWLWGAKLKGDGGEYRVRWSVDGGEAKFIDKWEPIWLAGWTAGKHTVKLELIDAEGRVAIGPIGPYNSTSREITITK